MNLVFIYTDEQRADTMAAYGNHLIETPTLNRLAGESVIFDNAYCTQAVCTPARSSILTGLYPHANNCFTNTRSLSPDVRCLPEYLPQGKYATAHIGKWHIGDELFAQHGFDEWVGTEDGYHPYYSEGRDPNTWSDYKKYLVAQGFPPVTTRSTVACMSEQFTKARFVGRKTAEYISKNKSHPFVVYANFLEPHMPFYGPRNDQYDPEDVPLPSNFEARPGPDQHLKYRLFYEAWKRYGFGRLQNIQSEITTAPEVEFPLKTEAHWKRLIANYWGLVSMVDAAIGDILTAIENSGIEEETIVVFTTDHGDMMGSHGMLNKMVQYQECVRVPLMIRVPGGGKKRKRFKNPVSQVDLTATCLELLGEPFPKEHMHGRSLRSAMIDAQSLEEDHVFIEWNGSDSGFGNYDRTADGVMPERLLEGVDGETEWAAVEDPIRTVISPEGWKLNVSPGGFGSELYNLHDDPGEWCNLIRDKDMDKIVKNLLGRLKEWQERTGDKVKLPTAKDCILGAWSKR